MQPDGVCTQLALAFIITKPFVAIKEPESHAAPGPRSWAGLSHNGGQVCGILKIGGWIIRKQ